MNNGGFIVSLDFELMWGMAGHDREYLQKYSDNIRHAPEALLEIIKICSRYGVKLTVAHVGAMTQSHPSELRGITPPIQPTYYNSAFYSGNIIHIMPELAKEPELFCCPTTLKELLKKLNVELASHTYSHYYCLEDGQTIEQFENDIIQVRKHSLSDYSTIIFPRNQVSEDYLNICAKHGFTHYRGIVEDFIHRPSKTKSHFSLKGVLRLLDSYVPITGDKTFKEIKEIGGMKNVPGSMFLRPYNRNLKWLESLKVSRIKRSMKKAAQKGEFFHLWWHPHNFGNNMAENITQLSEICEFYSKLHDKYEFHSYFISEL